MIRLALMLAIGIATCVFSVFAALTSQNNPKRDVQRDPGSILVILDLTDAISGDLLAAVRENLSRTAAQLRRGDRLILYALSGRSLSPRQVWSGVSPGRGAEAKPLTEGAPHLNGRFAHEIAQPLDSVLVTEATQADSAARSDILGALWQLTNYSDVARTPGPKRVVVVTDGIQNTPSFSFYRSADTTFFNPRGELLDPRWKANLNGKGLDFIMLLRDRDAALQGPRLVDAWTRYFEYCGTTPTLTMLGGSR